MAVRPASGDGVEFLKWGSAAIALAGAAVFFYGLVFLVLNFTIRNDKIVEIEAVADPARLRQLHLAVLND